MHVIDVDGILFEFADGWRVTKYDEWAYYRKFASIGAGQKAVDLLAISPARELFLIEEKDYRFHRRDKSSDIHEEICSKVVDTLAGLLPAKLNSEQHDEKTFAADSLNCTKIRIVFHLEQAAAGSRLSPPKLHSVNVADKLRQYLKVIDKRPVVVDMKNMGYLNWSCRPAQR